MRATFCYGFGFFLTSLTFLNTARRGDCLGFGRFGGRRTLSGCFSFGFTTFTLAGGRFWAYRRNFGCSFCSTWRFGIFTFWTGLASYFGTNFLTEYKSFGLLRSGSSRACRARLGGTTLKTGRANCFLTGCSLGYVRRSLPAFFGGSR